MPYADPEQAKIYRREWKRRNKDKVKKYNSLYSKKQGRKPRTKMPPEERKAKQKETRRKARKKTYQICKNYVKKLKENGCCNKCGEDHPATLTFHHRDPSLKSKDVNRFYKQSLKRVKEEISKCDMLCWNCHMKLHYQA